VLRAKKVMLSMQADYDAYHEEHARQWEAYYAGECDELGPDMEVAEGPTVAVAPGALLAELGLAERPTPEQIAALGAGLHPVTHQELVASRTDGRVAYWDVVYSAPKSVSVEFAAAAAAHDTRRCADLIEDLQGAASTGITAFAELLPLARRGARGAEPMRATPVCLFNVHSAARPVRGQVAPDPHLHVHMRVLNLAKGDDGKWSAINGRVIYHNIRSLNGLIEAELGSRLRARGYETIGAQHGEHRPWQSFELERVPEPLRDAMSQRQGLVEQLAQRQWDRDADRLSEHLGRPLTWNERQALRPTQDQVQALSRASREAKIPQSRAELAAAWGRVIDDHGYGHQPPSSPYPRDGAPPATVAERPTGAVAQDLATWALGELGPARARQLALPAETAQGMTAGQSVWTREELLDSVTPLGVARHLDASGISAVVREVERRAVRLADRVSPGIVRGGLPGPVWTTLEMLRVERAIVAHVAELAETPRLSVPETAVAGAIAAETGRGRGLDSEQEAAVQALCSPSGFVALIGVAGSGKTTVCRPAVTALTQTGYEVLGVSLSEGATQVLHAETGAESWNIADFLTRHEAGQLRHEDGRPVELGPRTVLLVDEAGTVDSRTQLALLEVCSGAQVGALRLIGDPGQTQPVGAGGVFGFLARSMPVSHLTVNYRQGDPEGTHEAAASRLLREGRGRAYLESKDSAGLLHVAPTEEAAIVEAVGEWAANVARSGEGAGDHVLIADTNTVVDELNLRARGVMRQTGRLGTEEVICGGVPYSVGDRVALLGKHVTHRPRVSADAAPLLRADGSPRMQRMTIPRRTRGEVIAIDAAAHTLRIRTDAHGRLPSRVVTLTAQEAAGESWQSPVRLGHGYAMTVAIAQARGWSDSYLLLSASRLTGLEQTYTAQTRATRCTRLYAGADRVLGGDMAGDWQEVRDQVKDVLAENLVRPTRKVTTLDYLDPGERAVLEERFTAPRQSPPALDSPASPAQRELAERLAQPVPEDASWLEASAAVDLAHGHAPGTQAVAWLGQLGIPTSDAWRRVASALEEKEVRNPLPRQPIPSREGRAAAERDPHLAAIEELLAAPPAQRLDSAERYRRERPLVTASTAPAAPDPPAEPVRTHPARSPRPSPGDKVPTVRSPRPSPGDNVPTVNLPRPPGVRAPRYAQEDEQRRRDQLARETAEQARQQVERQRGPRQGA
jgi:conjugative relaxase-like TrwC/TraI family protein